MKFLYPQFLLLLLVLIPLFYIAFKGKVKSLESIFSKEVLDKLLIKKQKSLSSKTRTILLLLALCLMIIALARPVLEDGKKEKQQVQGFDLLIGLDISKSMLAKDIFPSRLEYAKSLADKVIDKLPNANIGVVAFSKDTFLVSPLSEDRASIHFLLNHLKPEYLSVGGSSISSVIASANEMVDNLNLKHLGLLLLSDGADGKEIQTSLKLLDKRVKVYILSIGTQKGSVIYDENGEMLKDKNGNIIITKRNDAFMSLAQKSGGSFLSIPNNAVKIDKLISDIKNKSLKEQKFKQTLIEYKELFIYPVSLALAFLFISFNSLRFFVLLLFVFTCKDVQAGMLDFYHLHEGNQNYQNKEYKKAYDEFSKLNSDEAKYNMANAAYKNKEYQKAQKLYEDIYSFQGQKEHDRLHNLGNTYANEKEFDKAIESYEKSLKIQDDKDTKYNLKLAKKAEKEKKQQNSKNDKNNQKNNNKQDKQSSSNKENENNKKQENKQNQAQQNKEQKPQNKSSEQKKNQQQNSSKQKKQQNKSENKEQQSATKQNQEQNNAQQSQALKKKYMSESEAKKWEKMLENQDLRTQPLRLKAQEDTQNDENW